MNKCIGLGVQKVNHHSTNINIFIGTSSSLLLFLPHFSSFPSGRPCSLLNPSIHIQSLWLFLPLLALKGLNSSLRTIFPLHPLNTTLRSLSPPLFAKIHDFRGSLLLLLSCFSHVWLCATPETAAHQAPLSMGFSRQEHWSGLPFPPPMHESERSKWSHLVVSNS